MHGQTVFLLQYLKQSNYNLKLDNNFFDLDETKLSELKSRYPYSSLPDLALNKKNCLANGNISIVKILDLIDKTNNFGLAVSSVIGMLDEKENENRPDFLENDDNDTFEEMHEERLNEGIASEHLAKVYLQQGLKNEAIEIYKKISLQNKKKSNTFAKF